MHKHTRTYAKRNLDPLLMALQSARATSAAYALSVELRLALPSGNIKAINEQ